MPSESFRAYLLEQAESLKPAAFIMLAPSGSPLSAVEIGHKEEGGLQVRLPGRPPIAPQLAAELLDNLRTRGFTSEDEADPSKPWAREVENAGEALDLALSLLNEVFTTKPDQPIDVLHGSHREENETRRKLKAVHNRLEPLLTEIIGSVPERDPDGDYQLPIADVQVTVAVRALPNSPLIIRVFAVTNVGIPVAPEVGLMLARMNFGIMFGRFALDVEHSAIWFDETLLGEEFTDESLRFAVDVVARTADEWDDRLKQLFGGATYQEARAKGAGTKEPPVKPGEGPGFYL